jgi:hypothetical protein
MPNNELPQRDPFTGPPIPSPPAPLDVIEHIRDALIAWDTDPVATESSRCRGVDSSGIGRTNDEVL